MSEKLIDGDLSDEQIAELARENHIWLNAFACISPSDEFCEKVGRQIVNMLNSSPVVGNVIDVEIGKVLYVRLNKS